MTFQWGANVDSDSESYQLLVNQNTQGTKYIEPTKVEGTRIDQAEAESLLLLCEFDLFKAHSIAVDGDDGYTAMVRYHGKGDPCLDSNQE